MEWLIEGWPKKEKENQGNKDFEMSPTWDMSLLTIVYTTLFQSTPLASKATKPLGSHKEGHPTLPSTFHTSFLICACMHETLKL